MDRHNAYQTLLLLTVLAAAVPVLLRWLSRVVRLPIVVGEILAGIVVGQSGLGLVQPTPTLDFLAEFGFILLMFLSGLELDLPRLSGGGAGPRLRRPSTLAALSFLGTLALATAVGAALWKLGMVRNPVLMGLILSTTSLGIVVPVLKERGIEGTPYGQALIATALLADFLTLVLLAGFMAWVQRGFSPDLLLFGVLLLLYVAGSRISRLVRSNVLLARVADELSHATAQIRIRLAFAFMVLWVVLAGAFGVEVILGAFLAGAIVRQARGDDRQIFEEKLDAIGYGFFIPLFFILVGARFELSALSGARTAVLLVPVLVVAAYAVKFIPTLVFKAAFSWSETLGAGALLSSRLSLIIAAAAIARQLDMISSATNSALVLVALVTCTLSPVLFARFVPPRRTERRSGVIVLGTGGIAELVGTRVLHAGEEVTFVARPSPRAQPLRERGARVILGEANEEEVLASAGAATARAMVSLIHDPEVNFEACRLGKQVFGIPSVVARSQRPEDVRRLHGIGVGVVQPAIAMALGLEGAINFPSALSMLIDKHDGFDFADAPLSNPALIGHRLRELDIPGRALVLGIRRLGEGDAVVPRGDTVLESGDVLVLCGSPESLLQSVAWFAGA